MKKIMLVVLLLLGLKSFSQIKEICGEINYTYVTNSAYEYIERYKLEFNSNVSLSREIGVKYSEDKNIKRNSAKGETRISVDGRKNLTPKFFYNTKKNFYFSDVWDDDVLIVKEEPFKWLWNIEEEYKKIGNYTCQKATIKFRGRNYIAWFTKKIPTSFGPWKFQGLPGLILEVYDRDKVFYITANKISVKREVCNIQLDKKELKNALNIKNYLKEVDKLIDKEFAKMSAKLPKGSKPLKRSKNCDDCGQGVEIFPKKNK